MESKEQPPRGRRTKAAPDHPKPKSSANAIVRAAYKKVARDRDTWETMKLCLEENRPAEMRREEP
jgi:hypothetical protein